MAGRLARHRRLASVANPNEAAVGLRLPARAYAVIVPVAMPEVPSTTVHDAHNVLAANVHTADVNAANMPATTVLKVRSED